MQHNNKHLVGDGGGSAGGHQALGDALVSRAHRVVQGRRARL
jgi:hypothetical protein